MRKNKILSLYRDRQSYGCFFGVENEAVNKKYLYTGSPNFIRNCFSFLRIIMYTAMMYFQNTVFSDFHLNSKNMC